MLTSCRSRQKLPVTLFQPENPDSPATMPSAVPVANGTAPATNGPNGVEKHDVPSANDNIRRFTAPSRPLSPRAEHTLFHDKTRCFV